MAHFAELDSNNVVLRVIVVSNEMLLENNQESEAKGIAFCKQLFGDESIWVQTSYNGNIRKNYAGIGYIYDQQRDVFMIPQPEEEGWVLDETTCIWRNAALEAEEAAREVIRQQLEIGITRV